MRLRQFPPVSSNMLDGDKKAAMSGVFISHVRVHLNYSGNIDWNGTLEFKDWGNIDMGEQGWVASCQLDTGVKPTFDTLGGWGCCQGSGQYGHEDVWRVSLSCGR